MEEVLVLPTVEFKGGPYDDQVVVLPEGHCLAACTVFDLYNEFTEGEGHLYWLERGDLRSLMFIFKWDETFQ